MKEVCRFIESESISYTVKDLCEVIGIDRSSYYRSLNPRASNGEEVLSGELVRKVFPGTGGATARAALKPS